MSIVAENKSNNIKKLKESDFSITKFNKDLSYGKKHEKLVMKSMENFELKTDRMAHKTGNVYVEFQSRGKNSGILTSKSDTWIFKIVSKGDRHLFSIHIPLTRLKKLYFGLNLNFLCAFFEFPFSIFSVIMLHIETAL